MPVDRKWPPRGSIGSPTLQRRWPLEDPKGKPIEKVREIRDEIRDRVHALIQHEGWSRNEPSVLAQS
jgi:protein-tyrosine-phosphatase